jgi:uncharacterized protein YegP (UPF0339 family)
MRYTFEIYQDHKLEYRWRLLAPNGKITADSAEGYTRKADAKRAVRKVRLGISLAKVVMQ